MSIKGNWILRGVILAATLVVCVSHANAATNPGSRIIIPALGINLEVGSDIDDGPAWWPHTGRPGGGTTVAVAGHRTTHTHPFLRLNELKAGDTLYLVYGGRRSAYRVTRTAVVDGRSLHIADAKPYERLLLSSCSRADGSPTSLSYRFVVYALPVKP